MKKKIPLTILEALQPISDKNVNLVHQIHDDNSMFHLVDNDEKSDFYFKVLPKTENRNGQLNFLIERKPITKENVQAAGDWQTVEGIVGQLRIWLDLLKGYNEIQTIYDDPITKAYSDQFLKEVEIVDDDASTAPFSLKQQLYLDDYLSEAQNKIEALKVNRSKEEIQQLDELKVDAKNLQKDLTKLTKSQVVKRLSKFWGKAQKVGLDVIKEIFVSVTSEIVKRLITGGQ